MKQLLLSVLVLFTATMAVAQSQPQRSDFTIKSKKLTDAQNRVNAVVVGAYVGDKCLMEKTYDIEPAIEAEYAQYLGHINETDLNFDGYPDVDIYLGYYGGFANNTWHEALLWNQSRRCFEEAIDYNIGEPMTVPEGKYIYNVLSNGPDHRVSSYYRWHGRKLVQYFCHVWAIEGDDDTPNFEGLLNLPCYRFDAKLDGRIPVNIVFQRTYDNIVAGYIYYPRAKKPAPIMIAGSVQKYNDKLYYYLSEYQSDGIITGTISLTTPVEVQWDSPMEGTWTNPKTDQQMQMTDLSYSQDMPVWFTQSLLTPEDPGNIGREYSFQKWDQNYQSMMGGHITFRAAGKNKVHFECGNVRHNIAEGSSDPDRPAVLHDNVFEYKNVNECGYAFRATFFPRFVRLDTTSGNDTLDCFGMGASFDGVYIKIKQ